MKNKLIILMGLLSLSVLNASQEPITVASIAAANRQFFLGNQLRKAENSTTKKDAQKIEKKEKQQIKEANRLTERLESADEKRKKHKYPEAAAIYLELSSNSQAAFHVITGLAALHLKEMRDAEQIK